LLIVSKKSKKPKLQPGEPWKETLAWGKGKYNGSATLSTERPGLLDRDRRYVSPAKAKRRFEELKAIFSQTIWGKPLVREWVKGTMMRLYWPDSSYIYVDATGAVGSSGGSATKAKFQHRLV
jgi:hypothetical protein